MILLRLITLKPPNYYNIRNIILYQNTTNKMEPNLFMTYDQFIEQLGSWAGPLADFTKGKTFQNIYKYVKT